MGSKLSPVIIVVLVIVVIAIGALIFTTLKGDSSKNDKANSANTTNLDSTENQGDDSSSENKNSALLLSKDFDGEYPSRVTIKVEAPSDEEREIKVITLPDGTTVEGTSAEYIVEENGKYTFTVTYADGESESLDMEVTEIAPISANNPYIPAGFTHKEETTVENGFTIEDEYGNQYVWVPVEEGTAYRETLLNSDYEDKTTPATTLFNSVAKYYGFYIAKYEASKYEGEDGSVGAASMEGKAPWTDITYQDAVNASEASASLFGYEDCYTTILSSYAWDTTISWIDKTEENFSSSIEYGNYSSSVYSTGASVRDIFNNINDLCGNVREWTSEIYLKQPGDKKENKNEVRRVIRSGGATLSKTVSSRIGYNENDTSVFWGFRLVLYK